MISIVHDDEDFTIWQDGSINLSTDYASVSFGSVEKAQEAIDQLSATLDRAREALKPKPGEFEPGDRIKTFEKFMPDITGRVVSVTSLDGSGLRAVIFDDNPDHVIIEGEGWNPNLYIKVNS